MPHPVVAGCICRRGSRGCGRSCRLKFWRCAQNLSSLASSRTSTLSMSRYSPFCLTRALASSDSSGRMKLSCSVWLTTASPASIADGTSDAQYFPRRNSST